MSTTGSIGVGSLVDLNQDDNANKFLTFRLGNEEYGVEILRVREIIGLIDITPLPRTPEFVKGVINLRGKIIPVIELRTKFGLASIDYTEATCVIVVEVTDPKGGDHLHMGVIVDTVSEVLDIEKDQIEPAPRFGCALNTDYILGMGKVTQNDQQRVTILLDIDRVMLVDELNEIAAETAEASNKNTRGIKKAA
ncbi:MAG: chemotaxis protein CheW [Phycisphaeraceae bacterium]|nr:chemotaxis protein CheW [Phycisphaerales bacterium]MCB9841637.1 chemotaxis protein CheW [Phycisphaeraceae bacterium]